MSELPPQDPRRSLPAVHEVLALPLISALVALYGRETVMVQVRYVLESMRAAAAGADSEELARRIDGVAGEVADGLKRRLGEPLERVINATGIFLHTNLGRAPLPVDVAEALPGLLTAYCDLEIDRESGRRSDRNRSVEGLVCALTGAEAALVVNNNAAAVTLALMAHARGREVLLSRGELVEIGGSFRIHEIIEESGARLVEVGTTNRTRLADFDSALNGQSAFLMKVYPSNYRIGGFVAQPGIASLVALAEQRGVGLLVDEGSGMLRPRSEKIFAGHASITELVAAGAHLVCGSGDKLLGGPQAGVLVGRKAWVDPCRRHPIYRALRPDRSTLAILGAVLRRTASGGELPLDRLFVDEATLLERLEPIATAIGASIGRADAFVGGGTAPEAPIPGPVLVLPPDEELVRHLRLGSPSVVGSIRQGRAVLDLRTVDPRDDEVVVEAVLKARAGGTVGEADAVAGWGAR